MDNNSFDYSRKGVGRPSVKFEISLSEPFKEIENIKKLCRNNFIIIFNKKVKVFINKIITFPSAATECIISL